MNSVLRSIPLIRVLILSVGLLVPVVAQAQAGSGSPEEQLAERYVPVAYLREQVRQCGIAPEEGEPYLPLPVDIVLQNERVLVRDSADGNAVISSGPTAQELATFGPTTYLDFPGDSRQPGCTYETDERVRVEELGLEPTTYAHVVFDEENQRLALQYWFFWYFNDWNNTHESDWEMIQIMWDDVSSVEDALTVEPTRVGYAQHGNGELADWGDDKIRLEDGTHPLVYPAAGSHATFFSNDTFLAWGERNSGFGCDVSEGPSIRTPLDVVLVPNEITPDSDFAWLLYQGRWGERQPGSFNGPRGANLNLRWTDPWEASDNWRPFSVVVPISNTLGPTMTDSFCSLTTEGSRLLMNAVVYPWTTLPVVLAIVALLAYFTRKASPILGEALRVYRDNWRLFFGIGLISLPIGVAFNGIQAFLIGRQPLKFIVDWFNDTGGAELTAVMAVSGVQQLAMLLIVTPALVGAVKAVLAGQKISVGDAYRGVRSRMAVIAITFVILVICLAALLLTAIGFPVAIWLAVKWHFLVQVLIFEPETTPQQALQKSFHIVSGRWWSTMFSLIVFDLLAVVPGILIGFGLLTIGRTAVGFANGASSLLYAVVMPFSVIAVTLLYLKLLGAPVQSSIADPKETSGEILAGSDA